MYKPLFIEDARYSEEAQALDCEANSLLASLFAQYLAQGYSPRDISHIMQITVMDIEMESLIAGETHE